MCGNYSREETIQGQKLYEGIRYMIKKIQNGGLKKLNFSATTNSQYFFDKILGIGPWVST